MRKVQSLGRNLSKLEQKSISGGDPPACRIQCEQAGGLGNFSIYFDGISCSNTEAQQNAEEECLSYSGAVILGCIC